ncbi:hypothetical protein O3G_MSEX009100 [Manduca sexta]|uniref:Sushi domain-containing protein n=2 Tax=Manduca sexta TaxID=7130 RepID=A0A922CQ42_MANSE|nr:hypothetical protein O3G_MSEX009100 [Manduca sexta]
MSIYPGREVIKAGDDHYRSTLHRVKKHELYDVEGLNSCIKCPQDRTLIAKVGANRVMLQYPRLTTCSGRNAPKIFHFEHMYGPKFGSLLEPGSHTIIGRVTFKHQILQTCKMQINVLIQFCPIPHYLIAHCEKEQNKKCSFTCRDPKMEIQGSSLLTCGDDMKWLGRLPACGVRTWCYPLPPPEHGRISCKGSTAENGWGLQEGSSCRLKCPRGWRWASRRAAVCHRGIWNRDLVCQPKKSK